MYSRSGSGSRFASKLNEPLELIFHYFQDLIRSLEITNSARPARSRFSGQGFINCLLALSGAPRLEKDDWRFTTNTLEPLVKVGAHRVEQLLRTLNWTEHSELDPRTHSSKLQVGVNSILSSFKFVTI